MSVCVFLGPTLAHAAAAKLLDATYLPPARRGDIHAAVLDHGATVVGLVDGYFEQVPSDVGAREGLLTSRGGDGWTWDETSSESR